MNTLYTLGLKLFSRDLIYAKLAGERTKSNSPKVTNESQVIKELNKKSGNREKYAKNIALGTAGGTLAGYVLYDLMHNEKDSLKKKKKKKILAMISGGLLGAGAGLGLTYRNLKNKK